jgi:hypothetical protein
MLKYEAHPRPKERHQQTCLKQLGMGVVCRQAREEPHLVATGRPSIRLSIL